MTQGIDLCQSVAHDEAPETILVLLERGYVSFECLKEAMVERRNSRPQFGQLALLRQAMTLKQVFKVLEAQAISSELFGELAVRLGYLNPEERDTLVGAQASVTPRLVDTLISRGDLTQDQATEVLREVRGRLRNEKIEPTPLARAS